MTIKTSETDVRGLLLIDGSESQDVRGWFRRVWDASIHTALLPENMSWMQENQLRSRQWALRGFHFRADLTEWKLLHVIAGEAYDVVVDLRPNSVTFLKWRAFLLDERRNQQVLIPPGCAHGIQALSRRLDFTFKTSSAYDQVKDRGFTWNDPALDVPWPNMTPILSERDRRAEPLNAVLPNLRDWFGNA